MTLLMRRTPLEAPTVNRLFTQLMEDPFLSGCGCAAPDAEALALDISEDDKALFVRASLPGFKREEVDIEVHDGVLTIKAENAEETESTTRRYHRRERRVGSVSRRVALPDTVVEDGIKAELADGVLTLTLQKTEKEQPRKIKIG